MTGARETIFGFVTIPHDDVRDAPQQLDSWRMVVRLEPGEYPITTSSAWQYHGAVIYTVPSTIVSASRPSLFTPASIGAAHSYVCSMRGNRFAQYVLEGVGPGRGICRLTNPAYTCVWETDAYGDRPVAKMRYT